MSFLRELFIAHNLIKMAIYLFVCLFVFPSSQRTGIQIPLIYALSCLQHWQEEAAKKMGRS